MKSRLFFAILFMILMSRAGSGAAILSAYIIPPNPTDHDTVRLVAEVATNSGPCWVDSLRISQTGNQFQVPVYYNSGILTVICYRTDTFTLGVLPAGNYSCIFSMMHGNIPQLIDTANLNFSVSLTTSVQDPEAAGLFHFFPNPSCGDITLALPEGWRQQNTTLDCYTYMGIRVLSLPVPLGTAGSGISLPLPDGIYLVALRQENVEGQWQKLIIRR